MKMNESNAIEVDFTEVIENPTKEAVAVKPKKASLRILTRLLQHKAKGILKNIQANIKEGEWLYG